MNVDQLVQRGVAAMGENAKSLNDLVKDGYLTPSEAAVVEGQPGAMLEKAREAIAVTLGAKTGGDRAISATTTEMKTVSQGATQIQAQTVQTSRSITTIAGPASASAEAAADAALAAGKRTGAAAELRVGERVFTGVSGEPVPYNSQVTGALMGTPSAARAPWHGACAEIVCLDKALDAGIDPAGGTMRSINIGISGTGHNTPKPVCASCDDVLKFFRVSR